MNNDELTIELRSYILGAHFCLNLHGPRVLLENSAKHYLNVEGIPTTPQYVQFFIKGYKDAQVEV